MKQNSSILFHYMGKTLIKNYLRSGFSTVIVAVVAFLPLRLLEAVQKPEYLASFDPAKGFKPAQSDLTEIFLQLAGSLEYYGSPEPYMRHVKAECARIEAKYHERLGKQPKGLCPSDINDAYLEQVDANWKVLAPQLKLDSLAKQTGNLMRDAINGTRGNGTMLVDILNHHHGMEQRKGFTLVELSIVLVIVGLLLGGILVAQSMISTSKIEATAMQIGQFDAGVENFMTKYNYLPGDAPAFGGNGDGLIDLISGSAYVSAFGCDHLNFWYDIDPQQFPGGTTGCASGGAPAVTKGGGKNVPLSKLGKPGSFFNATAIASNGSDQPDTTNPENYYMIVDPSQAQTICSFWYRVLPTSSANSAVTPADMLALDRKIDDGLANGGNVLSGRVNTTSGCYGGPDKTAPANCSSGAQYALTNGGYECTPLIRIGAQAGDLQ